MWRERRSAIPYSHPVFTRGDRIHVDYIVQGDPVGIFVVAIVGNPELVHIDTIVDDNELFCDAQWDDHSPWDECDAFYRDGDLPAKAGYFSIAI